MKKCGYGLYDKELGLVVCSANGAYCNYKDCPIRNLNKNYSKVKNYER